MFSSSPTLLCTSQRKCQERHYERLIWTLLTYNHNGVMLLQYEEHIEALTQFRKGLDLLRNDITMKTYHHDVKNESASHQQQQHRSTSGQDLHSVSPLLMSIPISVPYHDNVRAGMVSSIASDVAAMSPHNTFVLYERAFVFDPVMMHQRFMSPSKSSTSSNLYQLLCTSTLLFNMGITCHRHGLSSAGSNQTTFFLKKALGLYEMIASLLVEETSVPDNKTIENDCSDTSSCQDRNPIEVLNLVTESHDDDDRQENAVFFLLQLALWSNMGHIYSHFFMNSEMEQCRIELTKLLQHPPTNDSCSDDRNESHQMLLSDEEYSLFVLNALLMTNNSCRKAAPAA